jgi:hypothetical protein
MWKVKVTLLAVMAAALVAIPAPRLSAQGSAVVETRTPALTPTDDGRRLAAETVGSFDLLGVSLPTVPRDALFARARVDGRWTPWMPLEINADHRPEGRERATGATRAPGIHSDPVWFGGADA